MSPETDDDRLYQFASFAAGVLLMRWYLDYPLVDMTVDGERVAWVELEGRDEQMPTLHKLLITCAGIVATWPLDFLPLGEQHGDLADELKQLVTPDFFLEYLECSIRASAIRIWTI